ncbi:bifunctional riboflavin kinase/FAD synthetase [Saxibacter everestensis]|uniref:Riboflavin biosynthesis protein n=1 Tax=Saxibacter everestensis TaxID=2909229 RepID=A0ABY8QWC4_9MICO|nr:bifunctional riboflavin kinase/FAD synthetase [Brevibacteriaceae bacterium ZFBP1038]
MKLFRELAEIPADFGPSAVTIGNFDGVHLGHQKVLGEIVADARSRGQSSIAITFDPHPALVHRPDDAPELITGLSEKIRRLEATGLDAVLVQTYTLELARNSPEDYVKAVFVEALNAATVVVGRDVRFGWENTGDLATMRALGEKYGFVVEVIDDLGSYAEGIGDDLLPSGGRWSSTQIRQLLSEGDAGAAATMLGRPHVVSGTVVHGDARGRDLGFPTANLGEDTEGLVPADGVYAGWITLDDEKQRHPAAISVGTNPTFEGNRRRVEAHVIDRSDADVMDFDLYGRVMTVEFVAHLRPMVAYKGLEPLVEQMTSDVGETREVLGLRSGKD